MGCPSWYVYGWPTVGGAGAPESLDPAAFWSAVFPLVWSTPNISTFGVCVGALAGNVCTLVVDWSVVIVVLFAAAQRCTIGVAWVLTHAEFTPQLKRAVITAGTVRSPFGNVSFAFIQYTKAIRLCVYSRWL
jgi:hypothetical protein